MPEPLSEVELRVLGSLVEKALTTPDYYPLTLNALVAACNQKSNRAPVVEYDAQTVNAALDALKARGLTWTVLGGESRVPKYRHFFDETYGLNPAETAVLTELILRGPQTVGELRSRTERFGVALALPDVEEALVNLLTRDDPLVVQLPRLPGSREPRYAHLLGAAPDMPAVTAPVPRTDRLAALEAEVAALREEVTALHTKLSDFVSRQSDKDVEKNN